MQSCLLKIIERLKTNQQEQIYQTNGPIPIEDSIYFNFTNYLLQTTEFINLRKSTKFMAKKIFDIFLCAHLQINSQQHLKINLFNSIRLATKINEPSTLIHNIPASVGLQQAQYAIEYDSFQAKMHGILGINFYILTPYYFTEDVSSNKQEEKITMIIDNIIDFGMTIPKMRAYSPKSIFLGSFAYVVQNSQEGILSQISQDCLIFMKNKLQEFPESLTIANHIDHELKTLLNDGN